MKIPKVFKLSAIFVVALLSFIVIQTKDTFAATRTWTGGGGNSNLATAGNWQGGVAPADGDTLDFPMATLFAGCSGEVTLENNLNAASVTLAGVSFTGEKPEDCYESLNIVGNELKLSGNLNSSTLIQLDTPVTVESNLTITNVRSTSSLFLGANDVRFDGWTQFASLTGSGDLTLGDSPQGGAGSCEITSYSAPITGDGSSFSGAIIAEDLGITVSNRENDVARHASSITLNGGSLFFILQRHTDMGFSTPLYLNGGTVSAIQETASGSCTAATQVKTLTISSPVNLTQNTTFYPRLVNIKFTGSLTGQQYIKLADGVSGTVTLPNGETQTSVLAVRTIADQNDCYFSATSANNKDIFTIDCFEQTDYTDGSDIKGILAGTGRVGAVTVVNGGVISPGLSPGTLSTGDLGFEEGGIYEFEIAGSGAGEYDQINVTGTVTLGNGTLSVIPLNNFTPTQGQPFVIINNDGSDAVEGTFAGLPEGATVEVNGTAWFTISYTGGDGNDVVLTAIPGVGNTGSLSKSSRASFLALGAAVALGVAVKSWPLIARIRS